MISRRRLLHGAAMAAAAAWPRPALAQLTDGGRAAMAGAATAFLGALPDDARRRAVIAFADKERFNWHYVPRGREGLRLLASGLMAVVVYPPMALAVNGWSIAILAVGLIVPTASAWPLARRASAAALGTQLSRMPESRSASL